MSQFGVLKIPCRCEWSLDGPFLADDGETLEYATHYYATGEDMLCDYCRTDPQHGMEASKKYHMLSDKAYAERMKDFIVYEKAIAEDIIRGYKRVGHIGNYTLLPGALGDLSFYHHS